MKRALKLTVNDEDYEVLADTHRTLLEVLRDSLGLTGSKEGCGFGACGACTVLLDGKANLACLTLAFSAQGKQITTIEGLAVNGKLHPIQDAAVRYGAIQCGFCTPGWIMSAKALLDEKPKPTELEVKTAISGNLCRCTGYVKIIESIIAASEGK
ncbi:MAG: (2Fe-2S)-binding protein [Dehalococcoidia bacterium]|mgnify:CR=1 FL=1|nr:(2Fe-2S)-binding protein [Dehalococcoidia bacterium]